MSRRFLLTLSTVTALASLSPAAFSAAVVRIGGSIFGPNTALSGKTVLRFDIERLLAGTRMGGSESSLSLATQRAGTYQTFTGLDPLAGLGADSQAGNAGSAYLGESAYAFAAPDFSSNAATFSADPTAAQSADSSTAQSAPQNLGSASTFAAVPEPSSIALVALGAVAFLRRRRS